MHSGFPRKLGDPVVSTPLKAGRDPPAEQVPGPWLVPSGSPGSEAPERRGAWYRAAKATELAGRTREVLVPS
jgi:hypothetical protein